MERFRRILVLLSIGVSAYYLYWRTGTFNPDAPIFSLIVYGAEVYGFIASLLFFFMVWKLPERRSPYAPPGFTVDVFIPTLNEDLETLEKTIKGCLSMRYPHKTYVLDDGNRPEVKELCKKLGVGYIAREDNKNAKAGNLNNALRRTSGELIAIFDADHVPQPDFLEKTVGYFRDERIAYVQTPQEFYNVDSYQHRIVKGRLWHEQALFFRIIMRGKDRHNAAFFCGSCAVIRRKALEDIGGFAEGTVTEDLHTSVRLHAKGWKSVYHPEVLAYGIAPISYKPFKKQRERWGQGAMQVFVKDNPIFKRGLTWQQRINYLASMTTYFDGFQKLIYYIAPVIVLLTGIYPISVSLSEFLPVFIPHILLSIWAFEEMSRGYGKFLLLEQYNMARFFSFIKSVIGFLKFNKLKFRVTEKRWKGANALTEAVPQLGILIASITGILWALLNFDEIANKELYIANIFWAGLNIGIAVTCLLWTFSKKYLRKDFRFPANFPAILEQNGFIIPAAVKDIHEKGAAIVTAIPLEKGRTANIKLRFEDKELNLSGTVLYTLELSKGNLYRSGVKFENLTEEERDSIREFNFRFFLKKLMDDIDRVQETPAQKFMKIIKLEHFRRKGKRIPIQVPGVVSAENDSIPFTTEDVSDKGIRILTYNRLNGDVITVHMGSPLEEKALKGRIVWEKELNFYGIKAYRYGISFEDTKAVSEEAEEAATVIR